MAKKKVSDQNNIEAPEFNDKKGIALEDQLIRVFDDVLEDKEQIIKGYKPVKSKIGAFKDGHFVYFEIKVTNNFWILYLILKETYILFSLLHVLI